MDHPQAPSRASSILGGSPYEGISMIYGFLADFDDVLNLSQTCQTLRATYEGSKLVIIKSIAATSNTYKYDRILCRHDSAIKELRQRYEASDGRLNEVQSQTTRRTLDRLRGATPKDISDEEANLIFNRWESFHIIRRLYVNFLPDFEVAHFDEVSMLASLKKDSLPIPLRSHDLQDETSEPTYPQLAKSFKTCFHQALFGAYSIYPTREERFAGLEVFDFICSFLIPELCSHDPFITRINPLHASAQTYLEIGNLREGPGWYDKTREKLGSPFKTNNAWPQDY
ncbi:MAG: hypothetical protein Q9219_000404 [cf. Caloplaca sp. 3 TL-2023]